MTRWWPQEASWEWRRVERTSSRHSRNARWKSRCWLDLVWSHAWRWWIHVRGRPQHLLWGLYWARLVRILLGLMVVNFPGYSHVHCIPTAGFLLNKCSLDLDEWKLNCFYWIEDFEWFLNVKLSNSRTVNVILNKAMIFMRHLPLVSVLRDLLVDLAANDWFRMF